MSETKGLRARIEQLFSEYGLPDLLEAEELESLAEELEDTLLPSSGPAAGKPCQRTDTERLDGLERLLLAGGGGATGFEVQPRPDWEQSAGLLLTWKRKRSLRRAIDAALDGGACNG